VFGGASSTRGIHERPRRNGGATGGRKLLRQVISHLILASAAIAFGAMVSLWRSADGSILHDDAAVLEAAGISQPACSQPATAAPAHPAKGANALVAFHAEHDAHATHRNAP
jgi:hypothetical protein